MQHLKIDSGEKYRHAIYPVENIKEHTDSFEIRGGWFISKTISRLLSDKDVIVARLLGESFLRFPQ